VQLRFLSALLPLGLLSAWPVRGETGASEAGAEASAAAESFALDELAREVAPKGRLECPELEMTRYRGGAIKYHKPVTVNTAFRGRLEKFEQVVRETAVEIYGRAPSRIVHLGSYNCRRIRGWPTYISEHGLGNAIDVEGFDFPAVRGAAAKAVPANLRRAFRVRVEKHWAADRGLGALHSAFLHRLTERLVAREDIFRVLLGPAYPGHHNHFHFDCSPWRIVEL